LHHQGPTSWLLQIPFLSSDPHYININAAILVALFLILLGVLFSRILKKDSTLVPPRRVGLFSVVDVFLDVLYNMVTSVMGHHGKEYYPFIATIFLYVFFCNLIGLLPHSTSPSADTNLTFALGICTFVYYNVKGIKAHGLAGYGKHFLMGLGLFGVPIALVEMVSHLVRPFSLGLRLFINLHIDHMLVLSFSSIQAWLVPVPLMLFGVVVCTIQAFLFAILTTVYVQMATEHD